MKFNYFLLLTPFIYALPTLNFGKICTTKNDCTNLQTCNQNICSILDQVTSEYLKSETNITDCSWSGHCLSDTCVTYDDCDGSLVCTNLVCSVPSADVSSTNVTSTDVPSCTDVPSTNNGTTVIDNVYISFYGFDDNDNGSGTFGVSVISNPIIHQTATEGSGTYDSPSTFASDQLFRIFSAGDIIYVPKFRKYYILEDTCVECTGDQNKGNIHIDLYMGGNTKLQGPTLINCENSLDTGGFNTVIIKNPANDLPVITIPLYDENTQVCNTLTF